MQRRNTERTETTNTGTEVVPILKKIKLIMKFQLMKR